MSRQSSIKRQQSTSPRPNRDVFAVASLAFAVSLISLSYYFQRSQILLYGDAIAHINIARRVFDSHTPGLLQLGTVWLPLPHLLMIPFLVSDAMWQTGIGGSLPSMIAYVFGAVGIFKLMRELAKHASASGWTATLAPWLTAIVYAANPNLIYLQTTAMTETVYLAFFIWTLVYLSEFVHLHEKGSTTEVAGDFRGKLWKCALCVAGAELTRYDGWFLGAAVGIGILGIAIRWWKNPKLRWAALRFFLVIAAAPLLWLAYNAAVYGNALEFANGPYSAKAIDQRSATPGMPSHPGARKVVLAGRYFLKSAELNMASANWGRTWVAVALAGLIITFTQMRRAWPVLVLWLPLLFYAFSIAYGGVPLFLSEWWPFTLYNARYGLQLLPLFAISVGLVLLLVSKLHTGHLRVVSVCAIGLIVIFSYFSAWKAEPVCFSEARVNSRTKLALESAVARTLRGLPHNSEYLMYLGDHVGAFQQAGIPLRQVINEGNHRSWKRPSDPEGLWERALGDPARHADFVIAFDGDPVDRTVNKKQLTLLSVIHTTGQPEARIYAARAKLAH